MSEPGVVGGEGFSGLEGAAALEELIEANHESNRTMASLVERVQEETAARDRKVEALEKSHRQVRWLIVLAVFLVIAMLILGVVNAVNINSARQAAKASQQTNRTLLDCLNSTGNCGRVNAQKQREILDSVKQYELTIIYCARTSPQQLDASGNKFIKCVNTLYPGGPSLNRDGQ